MVLRPVPSVLAEARTPGELKLSRARKASILPSGEGFGHQKSLSLPNNFRRFSPCTSDAYSAAPLGKTNRPSEKKAALPVFTEPTGLGSPAGKGTIQGCNIVSFGPPSRTRRDELSGAISAIWGFKRRVEIGAVTPPLTDT